MESAEDEADLGSVLSQFASCRTSWPKSQTKLDGVVTYCSLEDQENAAE